MTKIVGVKSDLELTWNLARKCNYSCSYCNTELTGTIFNDISFIDDINKYSGYIKLLILSGGEPTLSSILPDVIKESVIPIKLWTNLAKDIKYYEDLLNIKKFKINTTFHPEYTKYNELIKKLSILSQQSEITCDVMITNKKNLNLDDNKIKKLELYSKVNISKIMGIPEYYKEHTHTPSTSHTNLLYKVDGVPYYGKNKLNLKTILVKCDINKNRIVLDSDKKYKCCNFVTTELSDFFDKDYILCKDMICPSVTLSRGTKIGIFKYLNLDYEL